MKTRAPQKQQGFTIIEVMIVLAIAGLIMLIVFLAVPALQRNSRNTQRKNDVATLLGAIAEHTNNHGGKLPTTKDEFLDNAKLGFYDANDITYAAWSSDVDPTVADDIIYILRGAKCIESNGKQVSAKGSSRQIAVRFSVETGAGEEDLCQES